MKREQGYPQEQQLRDPAKAIGSELAGASLQAQEEKVSDFIIIMLFTVQSKKREVL